MIGCCAAPSRLLRAEAAALPRWPAAIADRPRPHTAVRTARQCRAGHQRLPAAGRQWQERRQRGIKQAAIGQQKGRAAHHRAGRVGADQRPVALVLEGIGEPFGAAARGAVDQPQCRPAKGRRAGSREVAPCRRQARRARIGDIETTRPAADPPARIDNQRIRPANAPRSRPGRPAGAASPQAGPRIVDARRLNACRRFSALCSSSVKASRGQRVATAFVSPQP